MSIPKRLRVSLHISLFLLIFCFFCLRGTASAYPAGFDDETNRLFSLVKPSYVLVTLKEDGDLYEKAQTKSKKIITEPKGSELLILKDHALTWYYVKDTFTGEIGWIEGKRLLFPKDASTQTDRMRDADIIAYVKQIGIKSETDYIVFTDINRQLTHILQTTETETKLVKTFVCGTGINKSPTIIGNFKIDGRGNWFYAERFDSGAKYWVRFCDAYLFHSVSMNKKKEVIDNRLGERCSNGCIRLAVEDAEWIYTHVPNGSAVVIR